MDTAIRRYLNIPAVVFETIFVSGVNKSASPLVRTGPTEVLVPPSSAFPSFRASPLGPLGFISWGDVGNGDTGLFRDYQGGITCSGVGPDAAYGRSCKYPGTNVALLGGSDSGRFTMVSSALSSFDGVVTAVVDSRDMSGGAAAPARQWMTGVIGSATSVPPGYKLETILYASTSIQTSVNAAYEGWGRALLDYYGKPRTPFDASIVTSHLGYSTTAYYFYSTEGASGSGKDLKPGKNFEDTITDVYGYSRAEAIPYRWVLLDSWWCGGCLVPTPALLVMICAAALPPSALPAAGVAASALPAAPCPRYGEYVHNGSGMYSWDETSAREGDVLNPSGRFPSGLASLHMKLGGKSGMGNFVQHMGKWRSDTHYASNPDWGWKTYQREGSPDSLLSAAWTDSPAFYDSLFANATDWGLVSAKHDHVQENVPLCPPAMEDLGYLGRVLTAEHDGLAAHGATLMGGGYTIMGWLHGVQLHAFTHARVSMDYACWYNESTGVGQGCTRGFNANYWDFNVGPPSMLSWALGILPYKDSFFSRSDIKGPTAAMSALFGNWSEPYPAVQALASVLSGGPVAPGDKVGGSNRTLIMQTCREDGILLKAGRPATPLDSYWFVRAFGPNQDGPQGELWSTECSVGGFTWLYVFGTMLAKDYTPSLSELVDASAVWPQNYEPWVPADSRAASSYTVYDFFKGVSGSMRWLNTSDHLAFGHGIDYGAATFYIISPQLPNGWTLLGETSKFIPVSRQRIADLTFGVSGLSLTLSGAPREQVTLSAVPPGKQATVSYTCAIGSDGYASLSIPSGLCV